MLAIDQYQDVINHIKGVIELTPQEEAFLVSKLKFRRYLKGQYIVQHGDVNRYQNFVISGSIRTFCLDDKGNENIVMFGLENWWVGDLCSFVNQISAEFNTQCLENTTVNQVSYEDMEELYIKIPQLERYFRIILQKAYSNTMKRIVNNHALSAKDRYILFTNAYPEIIQRVPQYMIASYLGITKEFLSSIRKQLLSEL